jgi:hypothetical protein
VRNLAQAVTATAKLGEIEKQLSSMKGDGRLFKARAYVSEQIRQVKIASLDAR